MKKTIPITLFTILAFSVFISAQETGVWFTVKEVENKIWQISDHGADNIYLVEGTKSALLIDNGLGTADLASYIKTLTSKPLTVVITHGHPDHAGSNYQFETVYMHAADTSAARSFNKPEIRTGSSQTMTGNSVPKESELYKGKTFNTKFITVTEGYAFDLGERTIEVMETPGHTPGGICLLDKEDKILFSGDNNNVLVWLFLENCIPLHLYLETLEMQKSRLSEFTTLMPGHGEPIPSDFINDQIACVKGILDGTLERKEYKSFAGTAMIATYDKASVAFNPDNL